jgi:transcriptional regulator with XRE-family HTH domain
MKTTIKGPTCFAAKVRSKGQGRMSKYAILHQPFYLHFDFILNDNISRHYTYIWSVMMEYSNTYWSSKTDDTITAELGAFIKNRRLGLNLTQQGLATKCGVNRSTIGQIEGGAGVNLTTFIQVLRALDGLHLLDAFKPTDEISPILLAEAQKKMRQRASGAKSDRDNMDTQDSEW